MPPAPSSLPKRERRNAFIRCLVWVEGRICRREYWLKGVLPLVFVHAVLRDLIGHEIVSAKGHPMRRAVSFFFVLLLMLAFVVPAHASNHCQFVLGFATLREIIGHDIVGECLENQRYAANGNAEQRTTGGLLVWRKADNWTAFSDGYHTWINSPNGLVQRLNTERLAWEADSADFVPAAATPQPVVPFSLRDYTNGPWLEQQHPQLASAIQNLGWVRDSIDDRESEVIQNLLYIVVTSHSVAASIISLNWVQDGIDDVEAEAIRWLDNIGSAKVASSVVSLVWVQDSINETEVKAIQETSYIDYADSEVASSVVSLAWVQDGIENFEVDVIDSLASIANTDAEEGLRIVGMPFLETIEPPDISASRSLSRLAYFEPEAFARVMSHATLQSGISNGWAPIVATLYGVAKTNPGLIDVLLDRTRVTLERRTITLPLAGDVVLAIIRTGPGAARSMDILERSVRSAEAYMGVPLPTNYVGLLYENAVVGDFAGTYFGTHTAILPKYDVDDSSYEAAHTSVINAHEVAHYYWSGNEDWIDEGAADFLGSIIVGVRYSRPMSVRRFPCAYADSIADLENLDVERGDIEFSCNYALGGRLFADLHRTLGEEEFRQGFRALYLASEIEDDDGLRGTSVGIEHVREAFRSNDAAESAVIARWYSGTHAYDLSRLDLRSVNPDLPSINGRINKAYISTSEDGPAVSVFSARDVTDWVYLTLKYSYRVSGAMREVPLQIAEYYEDGFEFRRRSDRITAESRYIGGTSWRSVGFSPSREWAPGRYWVYVYAGSRKVAEAQYLATP